MRKGRWAPARTAFEPPRPHSQVQLQYQASPVREAHPFPEEHPRSEAKGSAPTRLAPPSLRFARGGNRKGNSFCEDSVHANH